MPIDDFTNQLEEVFCAADGSLVAGNDNVDMAYRWHNGVIERLEGVSHGDDYTRAEAVSDDGRVIVGGRQIVLQDGIGNNQIYGPFEAVRWVDGALEILERPAGSQSAVATAVSADGSIVLGNFANSGGTAEAFIWTEEFGMLSLRNYFESEYGVDTTGWWFNTANVVTPDAKVMYGIGWDPDNNNILWRFSEDAPLTLTLDPSKPIYKLGEEMVAEVRVKHTLSEPATYTFPENLLIIAEIDGDGAAVESPILEKRESEVEPFELSFEDPERTFLIPMGAIARGPANLKVTLERTDVNEVTEVLSAEVELMVSPLEPVITITPDPQLLNQTPEQSLGDRARAINQLQEDSDLPPYENLIEIEMVVTNASDHRIEAINIPGAVDVLRLISSPDLENPGVPLDPISFYQPNGPDIDLTAPGDLPINDVVLEPGESATYAWVVDAYDGNPDPGEDNSKDLEFEALVLGSLGGENVRALGTEEFSIVERPLLEWGIRPKDGRTAYMSGQVVRVDGVIENVSTADGNSPVDLRVMVYQTPEGNLGGGFMFDTVNEGQPTPKYYEIFDLPAEGAGKRKDLAAILRSFPTVQPSEGKVEYGVRLWTVKVDPEMPDDPEIEEASQQAVVADGWMETFDVTFSANRPAFTSQEDCYALVEDIPELTGIWPFLCGLEQGLTVDFTDGIIGLGKFLFQSGKLTLDAGAGIATWEFRQMQKV